MSLKVRASSKEHAYEIAKAFLSDPDQETYAHEVPFFVIEDRDVVSQEVVSID